MCVISPFLYEKVAGAQGGCSARDISVNLFTFFCQNILMVLDLTFKREQMQNIQNNSDSYINLALASGGTDVYFQYAWGAATRRETFDSP